MNFNANINNSTVTFGNDNKISVNIDHRTIEWKVLEDELFNVLQKLPNGSNESTIIKQAIRHTLNRDKKGLTSYIKDNISYFTSTLFSNTAGILLADYIKVFL